MTTYRTFLAALMMILFTAVPSSWAADAHGVLQVVKGDVQIKSAKDGKTSKAKIGSKIFSKDTIITGKDSRAKIVMVDNNVINVSPDTNLEIKNYEYAPEQGKKDVLLNVLYGKVRSKVEQKYDGKTSNFQLKTPTAVAGVRGTDFIAGYNPTTNVSSVVTFEGTVAFGQPGPGNTIVNPVSVTPGQTTEVVGNQPAPAPKPVPPQQLASMDRESKAETATNTAPAPNEPRAPAADEKKEEKKEQPKEESANKKNEPAKGASDSSSGTKGAAVGGAPTPGASSSEGSSSTGPGNSAGNPPPAVGREPASAGPPGGSMLRPEDFAGAPTSNVMPSMGSVMPPVFAPPPPAVLPPNELCPACISVIQNGNNTVTIRVTH